MLLSATLLFGVLVGVSSRKATSVSAALEDEEVLEVFGGDAYETVSCGDHASLMQYLSNSGNYYINMTANVYTEASEHYINVRGHKYVNMNGFHIIGINPGVLHVKDSAFVTMVHGQIRPNNIFEFDNKDLWYQYTISVINSALILRDVTVTGSRSAIAAYDARIDIRDGSSIDYGTPRYPEYSSAKYICTSLALGGDTIVNLQGGSVYGPIDFHSWFEEHYIGTDYTGDEWSDNGRFNVSGGNMVEYVLRTGASEGAMKDRFRFFGGTYYAKMFGNITDNSFDGNKFTKASVQNYMVDKINAKYEYYCGTSMNQYTLGYMMNNYTYNSLSDAILSNSTVKYSYRKTSMHDAVTVDNLAQVPDGDLYYLSFTMELNAELLRLKIFLKELPNLSSYLSTHISVLDVDKVVAPGEKVELFTKYANDNDYNARAGAERHTYEWEIFDRNKNTTSKIKGYAKYVLTSSTPNEYTVKCKITSSNKYGVEKSITTNEVEVYFYPTLEGTVSIKFVNRESDNYTNAVIDELVKMEVETDKLPKYSSGTYSYQWYYGCEEDLSDAIQIPGKTKSILEYKVDYYGKMYFFVKVKRNVTVGDLTYYSDEITSSAICINGSELEDLVVRQVTTGEVSIAMGGETVLQVSVSGSALATDLTYQWCLLRDDGNYTVVQEVDDINLKHAGVQTDTLTVMRNDAKGTYPYFCLVTDHRNNVAKATRSPVFYVEYRDAAVPTILTQPMGGRYSSSAASFSIVGLSASSPDAYYGGAISYKWYRSERVDITSTGTDASSLEYTYTGLTSVAPTITAVPSAGKYYYYCEVTNTIGGHKSSINTNYVEIEIYDRELNVEATLDEGFEHEEIDANVGDEITLSYTFTTSYINSTHKNAAQLMAWIHCEELDGGTWISEDPVRISGTSLSDTYRVTATVTLEFAGKFTFEGDLVIQEYMEPYDARQIRGSNGVAELMCVVNAKPTSTVGSIVNVAKGASTVIPGNVSVGNMDYYRTGQIGSDLAGTNVYYDINRNPTSVGPLASYDNFKKYELFVETASGNLVKASESTVNGTLPAFNFSSFNNSLTGEDKFASDFMGSLNAFIRVTYDDPLYFMDIEWDVYKKGLYITLDETFDTELFMISLTEACAHDAETYYVCDHTTNKVGEYCYGCGEQRSLKDIEFTNVAEVAATCHEDGVAAHLECPHCGKAFNNNKEEVTFASLKIEALGHAYEKVAAKASTCTEKGNVEYYRCTHAGCDEIFLLIEDKYVEVSMDDVLLPITHNISTEWSHNSTGHYHVCSDCGQIIGEVEPHVDEDGNEVCDICGRDLAAPIETVHVTITGGKFSDGSTEKDVEKGAIINVTADEIEGKEFEGWYINGTKVSGDRTANLVITEDSTVEARFTDIPGPIDPVQPDNPTNNAGLPAGAVVGIVIGSVVIVGLGGFSIFWFVIKKKTFADLIAVFKKK